MSRGEQERLDDIHNAVQRCLAYRRHLDSPEFGEMAYDAVLRNLAAPLALRVGSDPSHKSSTKRSAWSMSCIWSGAIIPKRAANRSVETTRSWSQRA